MKVINKLTLASKGAYLWLLDKADKGFGSDGIRIVGLGVFKVKQVEEETRFSITIDGVKYDRKTGIQRGIDKIVANQVMGDIEKTDLMLIRIHRRQIADAVGTLEDANKLHEIARIIGYEI